MAKSKIIKDLVNNTVDLSISLKRAKVLLCECGKKEILQWIQNELEGYENIDEIPSYRNIGGIVKGNFITGTAYRGMQYTNTPIPLGGIKAEIRDSLEICKIHHSVSALKSLISSDSEALHFSITTDIYPILRKNSNIISINSAYTEIDKSMILNIFQSIESRLIDIFLILEKEFGNLDELDIEFEVDKKGNMDSVVQKIYVTIFNDNRIEIGDHNKIKDTSILANSCLKEI